MILNRSCLSPQNVQRLSKGLYVIVLRIWFKIALLWMGDVVQLVESFPSVYKVLSSILALCKSGMIVYTYISNWRSDVHLWLCSELKGSLGYMRPSFTQKESTQTNMTKYPSCKYFAETTSSFWISFAIVLRFLYLLFLWVLFYWKWSNIKKQILKSQGKAKAAFITCVVTEILMVSQEASGSFWRGTGGSKTKTRIS